jgi:hypothetical protein
VKKLFYIGILLCFSAVAHGANDFSGKWGADYGQLSISYGATVPCSKIEVSISQGPEAINIESYKAVCVLFGTAWGPNVMTLEGEKVIGQLGEEIGTYKDGVLLTKEKLGTVYHSFNLKFDHDSSGAEVLKVYFGIHNAAGITAVEGKLLPVNQ